jgi:excisionase family DNA binding protein
MTVVEVAAALRVSRATIYRLVNTGVLPGLRVGNSVRVSRQAVDTFIGRSAPPAPN